MAEECQSGLYRLKRTPRRASAMAVNLGCLQPSHSWVPPSPIEKWSCQIWTSSLGYYHQSYTPLPSGPSSSVGKSVWLDIRRSWVQIPAGSWDFSPSSNFTSLSPVFPRGKVCVAAYLSCSLGPESPWQPLDIVAHGSPPHVPRELLERPLWSSLWAQCLHHAAQLRGTGFGKVQHMHSQWTFFNCKITSFRTEHRIVKGQQKTLHNNGVSLHVYMHIIDYHGLLFTCHV